LCGILIVVAMPALQAFLALLAFLAEVLGVTYSINSIPEETK
jgi:hypothetical protein